MIEEFISRTFATRNAAHLEHWRTKSFAEHDALGFFYNSLLAALDPIVEAHQGVFKLVSVGEMPKQPKCTNIIDHLEEDLVWINKNRKGITGGLLAIDNLLQSLEGEYMSALYKLKRLS